MQPGNKKGEPTNSAFGSQELKSLIRVTLADVICRNTPIRKIQSSVFLANSKEISCSEDNELDLSVFFDAKSDNPVLDGEGKSAEPGPWRMQRDELL